MAASCIVAILQPTVTTLIPHMCQGMHHPLVCLSTNRATAVHDPKREPLPWHPMGLNVPRVPDRVHWQGVGFDHNFFSYRAIMYCRCRQHCYSMQYTAILYILHMFFYQLHILRISAHTSTIFSLKTTREPGQSVSKVSGHFKLISKNDRTFTYVASTAFHNRRFMPLHHHNTRPTNEDHDGTL